MTNQSGRLIERVTAAWRRFRKDRRANVAVIFALALVPLMGVFGLATEGSYWLLTQRGAQNAADSAVLAAAMADQADTPNGSGKTATLSYDHEADGVAARFGFIDGTANTTVTPARTVACPANADSSTTTAFGNSICYSVTVSRIVPLYFTRVLGFTGTRGLGGQKISATAIAGPVGEPIPVCVLALQQTGTGILLNGDPFADLGNCTIFSDGNATCHGNNSGAYIGGAVGTDSNCGIAEYSDAAYVPDPYASLASNIPANKCGSYQVESAGGKHGSPPPTPAAAVIPAGSYTASQLTSEISSVAGSYAYPSSESYTDPVTNVTTTDSVVEVCGDVQLGGVVNVTDGNAIIVVENGQFDLNASQINTTTSTAGMTVVFQNQANGTASPTPWFTDATNGSLSAIDFAAPTSGLWSGVDIYDPAASGSYNYAGNAPAWTLQGIVYMPNVDITWSGIIGKHTNGFKCFDLVVNTLRINGTAQMFSPDLQANALSQCRQAGATLPTAGLLYRYVLLS